MASGQSTGVPSIATASNIAPRSKRKGVLELYQIPTPKPSEYGAFPPFGLVASGVQQCTCPNTYLKYKEDTAAWVEQNFPKLTSRTAYLVATPYGFVKSSEVLKDPFIAHLIATVGSDDYMEEALAYDLGVAKTNKSFYEAIVQETFRAVFIGFTYFLYHNCKGAVRPYIVMFGLFKAAIVGWLKGIFNNGAEAVKLGHFTMSSVKQALNVVVECLFEAYPFVANSGIPRAHKTGMKSLIKDLMESGFIRGQMGYNTFFRVLLFAFIEYWLAFITGVCREAFKYYTGSNFVGELLGSIFAKALTYALWDQGNVYFVASKDLKTD